MLPFEHESIPFFLGFDFAYHFGGFCLLFFFNRVSTQLPKGKRKKEKKKEKKKKEENTNKKR